MADTIDPGFPNNVTAGTENTPTLNITRGKVTFSDSKANYTQPDGPDGLGIFVDYEVLNRYEKDGHKYMLGVSSPGGFQGASVAFVQLTAPTLIWVCDWTAMKAYSQPDIPDPTNSDPNWILLDEHYEPGRLGVAGDGVTPYYRISGTYVYGHRNPNAVTVTNLSFPLVPWMKDNFPNGRSMPSSKLKQGISTPNETASITR